MDPSLRNSPVLPFYHFSCVLRYAFAKGRSFSAMQKTTFNLLS